METEGIQTVLLLMHRFLRYLRIAFTATCLLACVLLIVLWVRSYWRVDIYGVTFEVHNRWNIASESGRILFIFPDNQFEIRQAWYWLGHHGEWEFRTMSIKDAVSKESLLRSRFDGYYRVVVPHVLVVLLAATLSGLAWFRWRFSVRTLLIATTLIAIVLGVIMGLSG